MTKLKRFLRDIHKRSLWQILAFYVILSSVVYEVSVAIAERRNLPPEFTVLALILLAVGLPIILTTAIVQGGIPAIGRGDPDLVGEAGGPDDRGESQDRPRPTGIRRIFTWRNAILGGVAVFTLWALAAFGWLLLAGELVDESRSRRPPAESPR